MNKAKARALVSTTLIVLLTLLLITGTKMYLTQPGKTGGRGKPMKLHAYLGYAMTATLIIHLYLNYKLLYTELKALIKH